MRKQTNPETNDAAPEPQAETTQAATSPVATEYGGGYSLVEIATASADHADVEIRKNGRTILPSAAGIDAGYDLYWTSDNSAKSSDAEDGAARANVVRRFASWLARTIITDIKAALLSAHPVPASAEGADPE